MTTNTTVANMEYTTEQIVDLYYQYKPKEVMYNGRSERVLHLPNADYEGKTGLTTILDSNLKCSAYRSVHDCKLILRSPGNITPQELQELSEMCDLQFSLDKSIGKRNGKDAIFYRFVLRAMGASTKYFNLNETLPLNIANYLFKKQINFLNLPSTICVEQ